MISALHKEPIIPLGKSDTAQAEAPIVANIKMNFVWLVSRNKPWLIDEVKETLEQLIAQHADDKGYSIRNLDVQPSYVYLQLENCPPKMTASQIIGGFKADTSRVLRDQFEHLRKRIPSLWTRRFLVHTDDIPAEMIKAYVEDKKHVDRQDKA